MNRMLLIHWNADEANERAAVLERMGYIVTPFFDHGGGPALRAHRDDPPDAFVIDLRRLPSHGRQVAVWFRQQKSTRNVPIVFVEGDAAKTARIRELLPDAIYTPWPRIKGALRKAASKPAHAQPVVPRSIGGYSQTPLPRKLNIKPGHTVMLLDAPKGFEAALGRAVEAFSIKRSARGRADVILLFAGSRAVLAKRLPTAMRAMKDAAALWICWPKQASGMATDLTQAEVRRCGLESGLVDYKVCAVDITWSGLCFSRRK